MYAWKVTFTVNGRKSETIVKAASSNDARKLILAQYANANVRVCSVLRA